MPLMYFIHTVKTFIGDSELIIGPCQFNIHCVKMKPKKAVVVN